MNYYLINPAVAGVEDGIGFNSGYQWQIIDNAIASRDFYLSGYTSLRVTNRQLRKGIPPHHTIGGIVSSQKKDLIVFNSYYLSYACHFPLSRSLSLSFGTLAGMKQFVNANQKKFDMGVGAWLYSKRFFAGVSSLQLLQRKNDNLDSSQTYAIRQYYITGGYNCKLNSRFTFIPSLVLKGTNKISYAEINSLLKIRNLYWFGAGYRTSKAVTLVAGFAVPISNLSIRHGNTIVLEISYCYNSTITGFENYSGGKHEIIVGLKLPRVIRCRFGPSEYW